MPLDLGDFDFWNVSDALSGGSSSSTFLPGPARARVTRWAGVAYLVVFVAAAIGLGVADVASQGSPTTNAPSLIIISSLGVCVVIFLVHAVAARVAGARDRRANAVTATRRAKRGR